VRGAVCPSLGLAAHNLNHEHSRLRAASTVGLHRTSVSIPSALPLSVPRGLWSDAALPAESRATVTPLRASNLKVEKSILLLRVPLLQPVNPGSCQANGPNVRGRWTDPHSGACWHPLRRQIRFWACTHDLLSALLPQGATSRSVELRRIPPNAFAWPETPSVACAHHGPRCLPAEALAVLRNP